MEPIKSLTSKTVVIPLENIDTDQITPARYLKGTEKKLAKAFFADWRFNSDGSVKEDFPLNKPGAQGASILVAGDNYGCGSSREHAATHAEAMAAAEKNLEFAVDVPNQTLTLPSGKKVSFSIDPYPKKCLLQGIDDLGYLQSHLAKVVDYEKRREPARA